MPKFNKLQSVNFSDVKSLSVQDRLDMLASPQGQGILAGFTPAQLTDLFPKYYSEKLPNVGKNLSGVMRSPGEMIRPDKPTESGAPSASSTRGAPGVAASREPAWKRNLDQFAPGASDPGAKAQLSREHKEVFEQLKKGAIAADDPRVAFMKDISDADLKRAGIERGDQGYKMSAVQVSQEDIQRERGGKLQSGNFSQQAPMIMNRLMSDFKLTKEQAAGIVGNLGHESAGLQAGIQERNPTAGRGGLGWAQWTGPRRVAFEKYLAETGQSANDPEANYGFLKKELESTHRSALTSVRQANSTEQAMRVFEERFEAAGVKHYESRLKYANQALSVYNPEAGTGTNTKPLSEEELASLTEKVRQRKYSEREEALADTRLARLPEGIDPSFTQEYNRLSPGQKQKILKALGERGENGVAEFNEWWKNNRGEEAAGTATQVQRENRSNPQAASNPNFDINKFYQDTFAQARSIAGEQRGRDYGNRITYAEGREGFKGLCGVGTASAAGALLNDRRFSQPLGGNANSLSQGNKYLQQTGYYRDGRTVDDPRTLQDKEYLNSLPIGTVISSTGGRKGQGHVQVKIGPGKWVSDADQGNRVLTGGYGGFTVHEPNEAAIKRMNPDILARDPGTMAWMQRNNIEFKPPSEQEVRQGVPGAPTPPKQEQQAIQQVRQQQQPNLAQPPSEIPGTSPQQQRKPTPEQSAPQAPPKPSAPPSQLPAEATSSGPADTRQGNKRPTSEQSTSTSSKASDMTVPNTREGKEQPEIVGDVGVKAMANSGETKATGPLTAYKINKMEQRRDDTLVTDGQVQFTMNAQRESMKYNPDTGRVQVENARGETRQRTNPNELGPEARPEPTPPEPIQQQTQVESPQMQQQPPVRQEQNSYDETLSLVDDIFKSASFKRSVASSRFMRDSDPLGGHYDQGAYNLS